MQSYTHEGHTALQNLSAKYNLSFDSICNVLAAINSGGGSMAQFYTPELGNVQWMQGGMTMCSDIFNTNLQALINNLCSDVSQLLSSTQVYTLPPNASLSNSASSNWWGADFGNHSSSGSQNNMRYAFFSESRRLAIDLNGVVSIYDTLDHQINGIQQQQGSQNSITFSSQYGEISTLNLPLISGAGQTPNEENTSPLPAQPLQNDPSLSQNSIFEQIEQLSTLFESGILTQQEFESKKSELLSRI